MLYVFLNTKRMPTRKGPKAGEVPPFITSGDGVAAGFTRSDARKCSFLGRRVPAFVARLRGWRVHKMGA